MDHAVNWEAISAIGQIVGAIALVVSLIYVASEVRRNTRATHLAAIRSMHDAFNRWIQQIAEHPHLTEVYILLLAAVVTPIMVWLIWHSPLMFARSGSLVVFFSVFT